MRTLTAFLLASAVLLAPALARAQTPDKDTLVIAQGADADTLDPADIGSTYVFNIGLAMFATLYEVDAAGKVVPYLAESYTTSPDGKELTFQLHSGVTCQDGSALTAEDVAYSFNRAADPKLKFTGNTPGFVFDTLGFTGAKAVDPTHVTIAMANYSPIAVGLLAEVMVHCKAPYEKMTPAQASKHPVGAGPYNFVEWVNDDHITLERNPNFTLRPAPFKRVIWKVIPEASTRAAELIAGNADIITNVAPDQIDTIGASAGAKVQGVAGTRRMYVGFNQNKKFADTPGGQAIEKAEVRHALQYAVDVPTICHTLLHFECARATGMANPPNDDKTLTPYPYDPAKAEALLDAAGYKKDANGVRFELTLQSPNGRYLNDANVALAIGQYLSDVGVKTTVTPMEFSSVFAPLFRHHIAGPIYFAGTGGDTWSALYDMSDISTPTAGSNYTDWNDPEWFAEWKKANETHDPTEQAAAIHRLHQIFYERGPWLLLYFQPDFYGVSNRLDWQARRDEKVLVVDVKPK